MLSGVPILMLAAAQAVAQPAEPPTAPAGEPPAASAAAETGAPAPYGPSLPRRPKTAAKAPPQPCPTPEVKDGAQEIVVCAPRPQGYRIDPDVLEAQRRKKKRGRPRPPERLADNSCATVGPGGCMAGPGINIINAAIVAGTMISKAAKGENVGKMFITDPQPSEYDLYLEAKRRREAKEAEQAAKAKAKADAAAAAAADVVQPPETDEGALTRQ